MDELESRLEHQLSGLGRVPLAEPVPVEDLRRRARHVRAGCVLTGVVATATAVALIAAVVVVTRRGTDQSQIVRVAAPDFILGDIDAVVLSSSLDADGARNPLPASLVATVAKVPGVSIVSGVVDTFAPVADPNRGTNDGLPEPPPGVPPRTPILFTYHEGDSLQLTGGSSPAASNEIVVDADLLTRSDVALGDSITLRVRNANTTFKIVGTFELPGVDLSGIPLAALSASYQPPGLAFDRLDVKFKDGADAAKVRDDIAIAAAGYTVAQPSVISFPDQRLAQLEIQHAYWALLSPDAKERSGSGVAHDSQEAANYEKYRALATHVELRVENVAFFSPDAAALTYRIYYGGAPSPIIDQPQTGSATRVDGHWQLGTSTLCSLAALVGIKCEGAAANAPITAPNGWQPISTLDPEIVHAFRTLADPKSSVAERVAVVANGDRWRAVIAAGVKRDQAYTGDSTLTLAGWRSESPTSIEVLYSLATAGGPFTGTAQNIDGHWYASALYACGLSGLATGGCPDTTEPTG